MRSLDGIRQSETYNNCSDGPKEQCFPIHCEPPGLIIGIEKSIDRAWIMRLCGSGFDGFGVTKNPQLPLALSSPCHIKAWVITRNQLQWEAIGTCSTCLSTCHHSS